MPATGATTSASATALLEHGDLRVDRRDARARRVDLLAAARRRCRRAERFARGAHALRGAALPLPRHVHARLRIVALLLRAGVGLEQRLEPIEVELRGLQLGLDRGDLGLGGVDLRLGLADVLGARAGPSSRSCASAAARSARSALNLQLGVARVERRDHVAGD